MSTHRVMVIFNKAPYERIAIVEGIRCITGVVTMGIEGTTVFIDDGVYALLKNQDPTGAGVDPIGTWLKLLESNKVPIKVMSEALSERGIQEKDLMELDTLEIISAPDLAQLMLDYSSVFVI
jgi:tRNA 2-thiouridine synthesizing protein C